MRIYLAGGQKSDWRRRVFKHLDTWHDIYAPKYRPDETYHEYGTWDLHHVKHCDVLLAYMEKDNPSGYGMCAEIGYAKGLGKTIIFAIETGHEKEPYFDFIKHFADVVYDNLEDAIEYLKSYEQ